MSVDKAKDTSPKKTITENKIVEAKPESSTKTENKPDATPKKQVMARVRSQYPKPIRTIGTTFLGKRKSDSTCRQLHGGPMQPRQFWCSLEVLGEAPMLIPSRQVHLWAKSVPIPSSNGMMTTSVPIGKIRIAPQRGFIRWPEVGRADWGKS